MSERKLRFLSKESLNQNSKSSLREWAERNGFFDDAAYNFNFSKYHLSREKHKKEKLGGIVLKSYMAMGERQIEKRPPLMHGPLFQRHKGAMLKLSSQVSLPKEGPVIAAEVDDKRA